MDPCGGSATKARSSWLSICERHLLERDYQDDTKDHPEAEMLLSRLPPELWAKNDYDVGCVRHHCVKVDIVPGHMPVWQPQYRMKEEAREGIRATIQGLLQAGVIRPSASQWNTPILPVPKSGGEKWRLVHDLRRINAATVTDNTPVPKPYVALNNVRPEHQWFSVVDLANAFFCLPLHPGSQEIYP